MYNLKKDFMRDIANKKSIKLEDHLKFWWALGKM